MGFKSKVTKSGMTGELYFVIVHANDRKLQGVSDVRLRSFESREKMHEALSKSNDDGGGNPIVEFVTDEEFHIPLSESKDLTTNQAYNWIRDNHYPDAEDC